MEQQQHYTCDVCHAQLGTIALLLGHFRKAHGETVATVKIPPNTAAELTFTCKECESKLPSAAKLQRHLKRAHGYDSDDVSSDG